MVGDGRSATKLGVVCSRRMNKNSDMIVLRKIVSALPFLSKSIPLGDCWHFVLVLTGFLPEATTNEKSDFFFLSAE